MKDQQNIEIFNFDDIDSEIKKEGQNEHSCNEISVFKDFALRYLKNEENNSCVLNGYYICNGLKIINKNDSNSDCELDLYFINKNLLTNNEYIFLIEIKDLTRNLLNMFSYTNYKIASENVRLVNAFFPMYGNKYSFIKVDVVKTIESGIEYAIYKYVPNVTTPVNINNFHHNNNWKDINLDEFLRILKNTKNINLHQEDLDYLKRDSYDKQYITNLLKNYENKFLIKKTIISVDNINELQGQNLNEKKLIKINGVPGSGKTVFAALLFITEKNVTWIVTNKSFFNEYEKLRSDLWFKLGNKLLLFRSQWFIPEENLENSKIVVIDEYQNIKNKELIKIIKYCKKKDIRVFLLGDYRQNIYYWLNVKKGKLDECDSKLMESLTKNYLSNEICEINWKKSNRFSNEDIRRIQTLFFNNSSLPTNKEKSFLRIEPCRISSLDKLKEDYKGIPILEINGANIKDHLIQYQFIGSEYNDVIIFLNSKFSFKRKKLIFNNYINKHEIKEENNTLLTWLYVAFTRATKSIKIFVDETNKYKDDICNYFNNKLKELGYYQ